MLKGNVRNKLRQGASTTSLLGILAVALIFPAPAAPQEKGPPVIVVGAGLSGLTTARLLQDAGHEVLILEARERIGGRTFTNVVDGVPLEIGAMFIHGQVGNPIAELAAGFGIETKARALGMGMAYDAVIGASLDGAAKMQLLSGSAFFEGQVEELSRELGPKASVADALDRHIEKTGLIGDAARYRRFSVAQLFIELYDSGPPDNTSLQNADVYQTLPGGDHLIVGGYRTIVEALAQGLDVRLGAPVERIEYGEGGVVVSAKGQRFAGSHAVVTVPLGVLQKGAIEFLPPLPEVKKSAIQNLDMANLEKVILRFEEAFWRDEAPLLLYVGKTPGELPAFIDFTPYVGAPTLVGLFGGRSARNTLDARSDQEIQQRALEILAEALGREIPKPLTVLSTRWRDDPFTHGSYSYFPVGSDADDMRRLGEPVGDRLLFAGEATVPEYYGTAHAAVLSGIREAVRLGVRSSSIQGLCSRLPDGCTVAAAAGQ